MARLITVHGTGAGAAADAGELWWQEGSPFFTRLGRVIDLSHVDVVRFHWDHGANSERSRREAGKRLCRELHNLDATGQDYFLIGHSHGGSVIYNALLHSARTGRPLRRLQSWCTVGTPFLDIAPHRWLIERLNAPGLAVLAFGFALLVATLALLVTHLFGTELTRLIDEKLQGASLQRLYVPLLIGAAALALATYAILLVYDRLTNTWVSDRTKRRTAELYAGSWIGISHADDEAIAALRAASSFRPQIVPRDFLARPFAMLPVILMVLGLVTMIWSFQHAIGQPLDRLGKLAASIESWKAGNVGGGILEGLPGIRGLVGWLILLLILLAVATAVVAVFRSVGRVVGRPIAAAIDRLVSASVRERAWGDDLEAETVRGVSSHPPLFALRFKPLAPAVADPISDLANSSASETLRKLRGSLGMTTTTSLGGDAFNTAMTKLSWREMIHTAYFDIDPFVRLLAHALHRGGLAGLRPEAWTQAERAAAHQAYRDMTVRTLAHAGEVERVGAGPTVSTAGSLDLSVAKKTLISLAMVVGVFIVGMLLTGLLIPWKWAAVIWLGGAVLTVVLAELLPVSTQGLTSSPAPARSFDEARRLFEDWTKAPEATIHPRCVPYILDHGKRVRRAYVLVHGISNCPYSMIDFAPKLRALGHNVVVVRMPDNGHLDNGTDALRHLTAEKLREFADRSIDIAAGLGERVHVIGISAGGVIAGWMAQNRSEIDRAVMLAPAFGLSSFGMGLNNALMRLILLVPNFSVWKDPIKRAAADNRPHSYKRQATRGMGQVMRLGLATIRQARSQRPGATAITLVTNAADAAIDPSIPEALVKLWEEKSTPVSRYVFPKELGLPHELIDPTEEGANIAISHPKIIELSEQGPEVPQRAAAA